MPADKLKADVLTAFTGGELTPVLAGRIDREESRLGSRYLSNFMPQVQGGLKKFYGTTKIATIPETSAGTNYMLVPFDTADETLSLVFVGSDVYVATKNDFYKLWFTLSPAQYVGANYVQINDVIKFTNETGGMFEILYMGFRDNRHVFNLASSSFVDVPYFALGWGGNFNGKITSNGATGEVTLHAGEVSKVYSLELPPIMRNCGVGKNIVFENSTTKAVTRGTLNIDAGAPIAASIGETRVVLKRQRDGVETEVLSATIGNVTNASWYSKQFKRLPSGNMQSYTYYYAIKQITDAQIVSAFSAIGATAVTTGDGASLLFGILPPEHQDGDQYAIYFSQGESYCTNPDAHYGEDPSPSNDAIVYERFLSAPAYSQTGTYKALVEADVTFGDVNVVGRRIKFLVQDQNTEIMTWAEGEQYTANQIVYSDGHYYLCGTINGGTAGSIQPIHTQGTRSDGKLRWRYIHSGYGSGIISSVISDTEMRIIVDGYLPVLKWGESSYEWSNYQWSMWGYEGRYPSQVFTHKGRLGYIFDSGYYGTYLQLSKSDSYDDFGTEEFGQVLDTCAINVMISGHADNRINWVLPGYRLYMGSYSGEYNVAGASSGALSPTMCAILPVSTIGGAKVPALKFEEMNLFVGRLASELYSLNYDYTTDDYAPKNVGFPSSNLLEEGVVRMQALQNTDRNVYFRTQANNIRFMNNAKEVGLLGFYRANLEGEVLDIACSNSGPTSTAFVLVKRGDVVTVEYMNSEQPSYMLSCRYYESEGDDCLEPTAYEPELIGRKVYVKDLETGQFRHQIVGEDGMVALPKNSHSAVVGIAMMCEAYLNPAHGSKLEGLQQKAVRFIVRLFESGAFSYGSSNDFDKWYDYNRWSIVDSQKWDEHHGLITGDFELPSSFGYTPIPQASSMFPNTTAQALNIKSDTPEPFNILLVSNLYV